MIAYTSGGIWYVLKIFQCRGSVFPQSLAIALPCAILSALLRHYIDSWDYLSEIRDEDSIIKETQAWSGFSFLVGFLIVFRTSQAYTRFWDGCTSTHMMRAEWFDACSALISFCKHSTVDVQTIVTFKHILVRLFSMLHAAALAELEEGSGGNPDQISAYRFELIMPEGIDTESLTEIKKSADRVELIFEWIQLLIVDNIKTGVLSIPAPILSRAFQEIANGMVAFHNAMKISYIPFPFPYAQTCDCLLVLHWLVVPIVTAQWVSKPIWAAVFVFFQVFILWSLNFIAVEIENPFGVDSNDLDGHHMQLEMNRQLVLLLQPGTTRTPTLTDQAVDELNDWSSERPNEQCASFHEIWKKLPDHSLPTPSAREKDKFTKRFMHRVRSWRGSGTEEPPPPPTPYERLVRSLSNLSSLASSEASVIGNLVTFKRASATRNSALNHDGVESSEVLPYHNGISRNPELVGASLGQNPRRPGDSARSKQMEHHVDYSETANGVLTIPEHISIERIRAIRHHSNPSSPQVSQFLSEGSFRRGSSQGPQRQTSSGSSEPPPPPRIGTTAAVAQSSGDGGTGDPEGDDLSSPSCEYVVRNSHASHLGDLLDTRRPDIPDTKYSKDSYTSEISIGSDEQSPKLRPNGRPGSQSHLKKTASGLSPVPSS